MIREAESCRIVYYRLDGEFEASGPLRSEIHRQSFLSDRSILFLHVSRSNPFLKRAQTHMFEWIFRKERPARATKYESIIESLFLTLILSFFPSNRGNIWRRRGLSRKAIPFSSPSGDFRVFLSIEFELRTLLIQCCRCKRGVGRGNGGQTKCKHRVARKKGYDLRSRAEQRPLFKHFTSPPFSLLFPVNSPPRSSPLHPPLNKDTKVFLPDALVILRTITAITRTRSFICLYLSSLVKRRRGEICYRKKKYIYI